ncbi:MAG TPA: hypothetical protein VHY76_14890 [Acetobacteraceae bacterium]|jgi:hypothetical protein|nr:hypothetical protein [Acetobacteraceae bacterium]
MDEIETFRARLAAAGLDVTSEQAAGIHGGWANLQQMIAMVRRPRPPEDEPAMIFLPEQG